LLELEEEEEENLRVNGVVWERDFERVALEDCCLRYGLEECDGMEKDDRWNLRRAKWVNMAVDTMMLVTELK